ncbi:MAG: efflux RND transporter periplasmic adaptor subunit [Lysobacteraceae bacterium]|nr:MAG: efflux RND transporter periplasmic adaptor subunit [Xanthomonadaceae bacterium]
MRSRRCSALALSMLLVACGAGPGGDDAHPHADADTHAHEGTPVAREGGHGGRWLEQDGHAIELAIAEAGTPPKFQAWLYRSGTPLPAGDGSVDVRLVRLGGIEEHHPLQPQADGSLLAASVVDEPHSFDVEVRATIGGKALRWAYASHEGRTRIAREIADASGIAVQPAGPGVIADEHEVQGLLTPVEGRVAKVVARFPGPIRALDASVGDHVRAGQLLATVESNLSLSTYAIRAPIGGVVLARTASVGALAGEGAVLFEIGDLSELWVDLHIFGADAGHIRAGVPVSVTRLSDGASADTTLERVLPGMATASQSTVARATIANADGQWRPGSAVKARITVDRQQAALAVPLSALQSFRGHDAVFIRVGDIYEVRSVELGKRDGRQVEVIAGLRAGDDVVVAQSYLVKADVEKSGASHDH